MRLDDLFETELDEASFRKTLGTAALGLGLLHGGADIASKFNQPTHAATSSSTTQYKDDSDVLTPLPDPDPVIDISKYKPTKKSEPTKQVKPEVTLDTDDKSPAELKKEFISKIKPLVDKQNNKILSDRKFLLSIRNNLSHLTGEQKARYKNICATYKSDNINDLLLKVDVIPSELTLAQAALESGWGTSDFAQNNASLFGQKASRDSDQFAQYENYQQSISAYMHNLNTNPAYSKFRNARHYMRSHNSMNAAILAKTLVAYDSTGTAYTKKIQHMITHVIPKAEKLALQTNPKNGA